MGIWKKAMVEEIDAQDTSEAWDIVELPAGRKSVGSKQLFKNKFNAQGKVKKYKARLVAKGYSQVEGIDFGEIFFSCFQVNFYQISFINCCFFVKNISYHWKTNYIDVQYHFVRDMVE